MHADRVEVSWDASKSDWLLRIVAGEQVILRHCSLPRNEQEPTLQAAALATVRDEGLEASAGILQILR